MFPAPDFLGNSEHAAEGCPFGFSLSLPGPMKLFLIRGVYPSHKGSYLDAGSSYIPG